MVPFQDGDVDIVPRAGTIDRIVWDSQAANNTQLQILVNGSPTAVTLAGASGNLALSVPVALGNFVELEATTGAAPGNMVTTLLIE